MEISYDGSILDQFHGDKCIIGDISYGEFTGDIS